MNFIKINATTGLEEVSGTTRAQLKKYYKNESNFSKLSKRFNEIAPEFKGAQIFPAEIVKKIIETIGKPYAELNPELL